MLVSGRATVGWLAILMPNLVARAWGIKPPLSAEIRYAIRLFGIRNALLSYQLYQAERLDADLEELEEALRQGIVVDVFDLLFALGTSAKRTGGSFTSAVPMMASSVAVMLGFFGRERSKVQEDQSE